MTDTYDFDITNDIPSAQEAPQQPPMAMNGSITPDPADANLLVKFYLKSVYSPSATAENGGVPTHVEKEYVDIRVGGRHDPVIRPATYADKQRFPNHYSAFKNRMEAPSQGYPLAEWSVIPRSLVDMLSYHNIKTVEQLANVADGEASNIKGCGKYKQMAIAFLEKAKEEGRDNMLAEQLKERDDEIKALKEQMAIQNEQIAKLIKANETDEVDEAEDILAEVDTPKRTRKKVRK